MVAKDDPIGGAGGATGIRLADDSVARGRGGAGGGTGIIRGSEDADALASATTIARSEAGLS